MNMRCPFCFYQWKNRVQEPKACPECKARLKRLHSNRHESETTKPIINNGDSNITAQQPAQTSQENKPRRTIRLDMS